MECFKIQNLTFTYPEQEIPALRGIDLSLYPGDFAVLAGSSGCGKSTLLRQLKTVLAPHGKKEGMILFNGRVLEEISAKPEGSPRIIGPEVKDLKAGDYLPENESERLPALIKILELIGQNELNGIDVIDLRDMRDLRLLYRGRVLIELGSFTDIDYKIKAVRGIVDAAVEDSTVGVMDVSSRDSMRLREINIYQGENWKLPEYMLEDYRRQL